MEFGELTEAEVRGLGFACGSFLQSWEMYRRYRAMGRESYFVGVKKARKVVAAGLLMARPWKFGRKIYRVAGGWLMDYDAEGYEEILEYVTREAREFVRGKGGMVLEIAPNIVAQTRDAHSNVVEGPEHLGVKATLERLGYKYLGEYEQVKWTFVKELGNEDEEEMLMSFRTDHRQRIRRAEREGVRVRELGEDELDVLKKIAAEAGERHGFRDPETEYYRTMKEAFGEKVKFVVAEIPAEKVGEEGGYVPLAAAMFVNDGREMVYLYSGSVREWQKYGGAHLIQWKMMREAMAAGCEKYNFYGVYPVEGNGVYNFKLGFRGRIEELIGTFALPIGVLGRLYVARIKPREYGEVR